MRYVDGFVIPIAKKNLAAYKKMALLGAKVWREHGALEFCECVSEDVKPGKLTSPIFNYPYARTREALAGLVKAGPPDACHGYKLRYVNPANGGSPMATMGTPSMR